MSFTFPSFSQWKQIFKVLKKKEKITFLCFFVLALGSLGFLTTDFYINHTNVAPALGGTYIEGVVGQPRFINPIYGETNDTDRSLIDVVFSGIMTYDNQGHIVKDLADNYTVSDDGKTYTFQLKNNIYWHDGKPLTADDVVFTVKTIQNSDYKSPLRANWIDVDVQKVSEKSFSFILRTPYNFFLENCTLKIIPKHIWENISPENFALSSYNLQPIGSGPFSFVSLNQTNTGFIKTLQLTSNRRYYNHPSYISNLSFAFFEKKEDLVAAANAAQINGFTLSSLDDNEIDAEKEVKQSWSNNQKFSVYSFNLPRYFAVFFNLQTASNQKSNILTDSNIRKALSYSINKEELVQKISTETKNTITTVNSPILSDFFNYQAPSNTYEFDLEKAKTLFDKAGFKDDGSGQRVKAVTKTPAFQFKSYLKIGSKGSEVNQLQLCLARLDNNIKAILKDETNGTFGKITDSAVTEFQKKYLSDLKPTGETGDSTRKKLNELCTTPSSNTQSLKFTLTTVNQPQLLEVAALLRDYWKTVGVTVEINPVSITDLKPIIKTRNYDALLYGEALGDEPDLYPFWHSSQKIDPGLNLSEYENKSVDQLLKDARETLDENTKKEKLETLQNTIVNDAPALFLYNPDYIYWVSNKIQGIDTAKIVDPAKRFSNITNWYLQTKRVWK
jgi:ABC-type transport system substrate-binding protein